MKLKFKHSEKLFFTSVGFWALLFYPVGLMHEIGHAVICTTQGGSFPLEMFFQLRVICVPLPFPLELYWSMGGIFGLLVSIIPLLISKRIRNHPILVGGLTGSSIFQFSYFLAETFVHDKYMSNDQVLFWIISLIVLASIFYFSRKSDKNFRNKLI